MNKTIYHNQDLSSLSFLVTGGAGFIGSNIVSYLLKHGAGRVRVLDNFSNGFEKNISEFKQHNRFEFIEGDIRDSATCKAACSKIDIVLHQAALGSVPRSIKDPLTTNAVNIQGFLNMLLAAKDEHVKRFVYAASSSTYGDSTSLPKKEDIIGKPLSPYAVTKYVNELYADVFSKVYNYPSIGLRYFNVFGPKQDPNGPYAAVIPLFMDALVNHAQPTINGDGEQTRDFTFVENAVQANIKAALVQDDKALNQIYNVAVGERTSLNQLFEELRQQAQSTLQPLYGPDRPGDIRDSLADISKARKYLNYQPAFSLKEGLKLTYEWFIHNKDFINNK